jgi:hypothetical protein
MALKLADLRHERRLWGVFFKGGFRPEAVVEHLCRKQSAVDAKNDMRHSEIFEWLNLV